MLLQKEHRLPCAHARTYIQGLKPARQVFYSWPIYAPSPTQAFPKPWLILFKHTQTFLSAGPHLPRVKILCMCIEYVQTFHYFSGYIVEYILYRIYPVSDILSHLNMFLKYREQCACYVCNSTIIHMGLEHLQILFKGSQKHSPKDPKG